MRLTFRRVRTAHPCRSYTSTFLLENRFFSKIDFTDSLLNLISHMPTRTRGRQSSKSRLPGTKLRRSIAWVSPGLASARSAIVYFADSANLTCDISSLTTSYIANINHKSPRPMHGKGVFYGPELARSQISSLPRGVTFLMLLPDRTDSAVLCNGDSCLAEQKCLFRTDKQFSRCDKPFVAATVLILGFATVLTAA